MFTGMMFNVASPAVCDRHAADIAQAAGNAPRGGPDHPTPPLAPAVAGLTDDFHRAPFHAGGLRSALAALFRSAR